MSTIIKSSFAVLLITSLCSCGLLGLNQLGAYKITVEVMDKTGTAVSGALLKTSNDLQKKTNDHGLAELTYISSGLHVITVSAHDKETKQFKVTLPRDDRKQISIFMKEKVFN